jgi:hypothetical protein
MTDFKVLILNKLATNFEKNQLKNAEDLTKKIFEEESSGGGTAVEGLLLKEIKKIIEESGIDLSDIESKLDDYED